MSSVRSHITLILSIVSIMISIFLFRSFSQILYKYEKSIVDNYSIVVVSSSKIDTLPIDNISSITPIDISKELNKLKSKYKNIDFSSITLPYFYKLKLNYLPSPEELEVLKHKLKQKAYIKRVMTKSSSQTKIYNLLSLLKITSNIFMFLVGTLGFLLIIKQLEVWKLIHSERMYIMELFGAPFWFRGAALFKIAFIDSIIALLISMGLVIYITNSSIFNQLISDLNINFSVNYLIEFAILFGISILISLTSSIIVVSVGKQ